MRRSRLAGETAFLFTAELLGRASALVVIVIAARAVGVDEIARLTVAQAIVSLALVAGDAGMGVRAVVLVSGGSSTEAVLRQTMRTQVVLTMFGVCVVAPFATAAIGFPTTLLLCLVPIAYSLNTSYLLQGKLRMRSLAITRAAGSIAGATAGCLGVLIANDVAFVALGLAVGGVVSMAATLRLSGVTSLMVARSLSLRKGPEGATQITGSEIFSSMSYAVGVHALASVGLLFAPLVFDRDTETSVSLAWRTLQLLLIPIVILESQFLPRVRSASRTARSRYVSLSASLALAITGAFWFSAAFWMNLLYGPGGASAVEEAQRISVQLVPVSLLSSIAALLLARESFRTVASAYMLGAIAIGLMAAWSWAFGSSSLAYCLALGIGPIITLCALVFHLRGSSQMRV